MKVRWIMNAECDDRGCGTNCKKKKWILFPDGTENADRKRQRLASEQEGQSASNDNANETETENREEQSTTTTPPTESELSPIESNEPAVEATG